MWALKQFQANLLHNGCNVNVYYEFGEFTNIIAQFFFLQKLVNIIINMTSQQIKTQYHSFIFQRRCSAPLSNPSPLHLLSSPKIQRVQNINPFLQSKYNCLSPNLNNQVSQLTLFYSPQKSSTMKEIKQDAFTSTRCLDKGRRVTLPLKRTQSFNGSQKLLESSPQKFPKTTIKFTYQNNVDSWHKIQSNPRCEESGVFLVKSKTQQPFSCSQISQYKINKNKLCSTVFQFFYQPISSIRRKSLQLEKLLKQLKKQADILSSKVISCCDFSKECKTSAAETSTSAMAGVNESQMMGLDSSRWNGSQSNSKCNFQPGFNLFRPSLADKIPSSKHLGKTILLNSTTYDFGGIIMPSSQQIEQKVVETKPGMGHGLTRDWDQLKGLISENNEQNMKQSIHCGPDVRANQFNCQMLQNFGRTIKESTLSYQE